MRSLVSSIALALAIPIVARSQTSDSLRHAPEAFCFRGRPLPRCEGFMLLEVQFAGPVGQLGDRFDETAGNDPARPDIRSLRSGVFADVGYLQNHPNQTATGLSMQLGFQNGDAGRLAVTARRRAWLDNAFSVDLSAGPLALSPGGLLPIRRHTALGLTGGAALDAGDLIAFTSRIDVVYGARPQAALFLGGRTGPWATLSLIGLFFVAVADYRGH
jgi:hypothetical protein